MSEAEVVKLMESSTSDTEWDENCDKVKAAFNGNYPPFWYSAILASGVAQRTTESYGSDAKIRIIAIG
ncbi:MAG: hypothetical protein ACYTEQ_20440 [Planctomycetota bacterium]